MPDIHSLNRRSLLAGGTALASVGLLNGPARSQSAARRGGTVSVLLNAEPPTLSSIAHTAYNVVLIAAKVQEGLLTYDFDLKPKPQLATSWNVSPDGLTYSFTLRPGVKWHDGKPFTSADVAFSIETLKKVHPRGRATFGNVVEIKTPDPLSVVLVLSKPAPYLLTAFAAAESPIIPRHIYEGTAAEANPANNAPIGTGPFVFKE